MYNYNLNSTIRNFENYICVSKTKIPNETHSLLCSEALTKLEQINLLLDRIAKILGHLQSRSLTIFDLQLKLERANELQIASDNGACLKEFFFHVRLLTEAYYYFAFRFRQILTNKLSTNKYPLPYLNTFNAKGVVFVRNNLLEHPYKNGYFSQDFAMHKPEGPQLKIDNNTDSGSDKGLFVNAQEFKIKLEAVLSQALKQLSQY